MQKSKRAISKRVSEAFEHVSFSYLETTVGYLLGENEDSDLLKDPLMLKRFHDIKNLNAEDRNGILYALDNLLKAAKLRNL